MPDINTLIKKSDYDTKIVEIESIYIGNIGFDSKLAQTNVITKRNFDAKFIELENIITKLQTFHSSYFKGKNDFDGDGKPHFLVFLPISRYFRLIANKKYISSWKSKGLSDETNTPYASSDNSLTPWIDHYGTKTRLKFNKNCLKQSSKLAYDIGHIYELGASSSSDSDPTLESCLFADADIEKYRYSGFGIGFD